MKPKKFIPILPLIPAWIFTTFKEEHTLPSSQLELISNPPLSPLKPSNRRTIRNIRPKLFAHVLNVGAAIEVGMNILQKEPSLLQPYFDSLVDLFQDFKEPYWEVQLLDFLELKRINPGSFSPTRGTYLLQLKRVSNSPDSGKRALKLSGIRIDAEGWRELRAQRRLSTWKGDHEQSLKISRELVSCLAGHRGKFEQLILAEEIGNVLAYQVNNANGEFGFLKTHLSFDFPPAKSKEGYMRGLLAVAAGVQFYRKELITIGCKALNQKVLSDTEKYFPEQISSVRYWLSLGLFITGKHWEAIQYLSLVNYDKKSRYFVWANVLDLLFKFKMNEPDLYFEIGRVKRICRNYENEDGLLIARFIEKNPERIEELLIELENTSTTLKSFIPFDWILTGDHDKKQKPPKREASGM